MSSVLFVTPGLGLGGAERHLIRYANWLARNGHTVGILVIGRHLELANELEPSVELINLGRRTSDPRTWLMVRKIIRAKKPANIFGWSLYANLVVCIASCWTDSRLIVCDLNYPPRQYALNGRVFYLVLRALIMLYRYADVVTANSGESLEVLRRWVGGGPNYVRLYNPIDPEIFELAKQRAPNSLVELENCVVVLAVGRLLNIHKGFDLLLEALNRIPEEEIKWKCIIVGTGPDEEVLKAAAKALSLENRVVFSGGQVNPFPFFNRADIFVLTSRFEGFPNVLLEALALGKAAVATDCMTGPREMIDNGRCGILVPEEDVQALADAICCLLRDAEKRKAFACAAATRTRNAYSDRIVYGTLTSILQ